MKNELTVALVQTNLTWESPARNQEYIAQWLDDISPHPDLVILPEMFSTGFTMEPHLLSMDQATNTLRWLQETAYAKEIALCGSIVWPENGNFYNRLFFVQANGTYTSYDKRHTFTLAGEDKIYTAGNAQLIVDCQGFKICPMICYDLRFPVWSRNTMNYDILLYVANWPAQRINAWDALLKARAIENMSYCIGVNRMGSDPNGHEYIGHSAIYDPLGAALVFSQKEEVLVATLSREHIATLRDTLRFLDDRDEFTLSG